MVKLGWGAWALLTCGFVLVVCPSLCLSQQPYIRPMNCSRREHPVVSYQGESFSCPNQLRSYRVVFPDARRFLLLPFRSPFWEQLCHPIYLLLHLLLLSEAGPGSAPTVTPTLACSCTLCPVI